MEADVAETRAPEGPPKQQRPQLLSSWTAAIVVVSLSLAVYNFSFFLAPLRLAAELIGAVLVSFAVFGFVNYRRMVKHGTSKPPGVQKNNSQDVVVDERTLSPFTGLRAKKTLAALGSFGKAQRNAAPFRPDFVRYSFSARLQENIDGMIELVVKDFVASWYIPMISKDRNFLVECERGIQHAVASGFRSVETSRIHFQDFAISRVLPLVLQHVIHFKKAEKRLRGSQLSSVVASNRLGLLQQADDAAGFSSDSDWDDETLDRRRGKSPLNASSHLGKSADSLPGLRVSTDSLEASGNPRSAPLSGSVENVWTTQDAELARHYHQTYPLHPAILPLAASTAMLEQKYLRKLVGFLLPDLAPKHVVESALASKLVREIVVCKVLHPLLDFLSDPDFWNETMIKLVDFVERDKLMSTVSETIQKASVMAGGSQANKGASESASDRRISTYDDLLEAIRNCDDIVEAKLLLKGVVSEMESKRTILASTSGSSDKATKTKAEKMQIYLNRLEVAKTRLDRRILRLEGKQATHGSEPHGIMAASFHEPVASLGLFMKDPIAAGYLINFLDRLGKPELLQAYKDMEDLVALYRSQSENPEATTDQRLVDTIRDLYDVYFAEDAPSKLPLGSGVVGEVERVLAKLPSENAMPRASSSASLPPRSLSNPGLNVADLDPLSSAIIEQDRKKRTSNLDVNVAPFVHAQSELYELIQRNYFTVFLQSHSYLEYLSAKNRSSASRQTSTTSIAPADEPDDAAETLAEAEKRLTEAVKLESDLTERVIVLEEEMQELLGKGRRPTSTLASKGASGRSKDQLKQEIDSLRMRQAIAEANVKRLREERAALLQQQQGILYVAGYIATYVREAANVAALTYDIQVERFDVNGKKLSDWTVSKSYAQFVTLHRLVKARFPTLVSSSQFPVRTVVGELVGKESSESRRKALDAYLRNLLKSNLICQYSPLVQFLTPERVLRTLPSRKELPSIPTTTSVEDDFVVIGEPSKPATTTATTSPVKTLHSSPTKFAANGDQFEFEIVEADDLSDLGTSAIVHQFVVELFDLQNKSNYWRRQAWTLIMKQLGGGSIVQKRVTEILDTLVSESSLIGYLAFAKTTFWPDGRFAFDRIIRTEEQKRATEVEASRRLTSLIPDLLGSLVGRDNAKAGAQRIFALFQNRRLNQELAFRLLDLALNSVGFDEAVSRAWQHD